jgi:hypothetical protein
MPVAHHDTHPPIRDAAKSHFFSHTARAPPTIQFGFRSSHPRRRDSIRARVLKKKKRTEITKPPSITPAVAAAAPPPPPPPAGLFLRCGGTYPLALRRRRGARPAG